MHKKLSIDQGKVLYYKRMIYRKIRTGEKTVEQLSKFVSPYKNAEWSIAINAAKKWAKGIVRKQKTVEDRNRLKHEHQKRKKDKARKENEIKQEKQNKVLERKTRGKVAQANLKRSLKKLKNGKAKLRKKGPVRYSSSPAYKSKEPSRYSPPSKMGQRLH